MDCHSAGENKFTQQAAKTENNHLGTSREKERAEETLQVRVVRGGQK